MLSKVIYMMGPPGAGKGTQAEMLAHKIGYYQFSTGAGFRKVAQQDTELGRKVKETIDNGWLAPPEMAAEIVMEAISEHLESGTGLVFDGTPRTVKEAQIVDDFFAEKRYGQPLVIALNVDREEMERRNSQRKYCLGVESDFPVVTDADKKKCEELGGEIGSRPDDTLAAMKIRWDEFMSQTYPVLQSYREKGMVHEVDGMQSVEDVHAAVMQVIDSVRAV